MLARLFSLAALASLAFANGYGGTAGIGVPVVPGSSPDWVIISSYLADYQVEEASIPDASVFVSGTWVPVNGGPDHHTNDVTIGNTIAWLPGPIMTYNDLFCPFQNGVTANTVALPASAAIPLPQFIKVEDGIFTFQTKNWDQIIAFQCVNGTGDIDYGGFLETCEFQINVPSTCHSFVANVAPGPFTPSKIGAVSVPYQVTVNAGEVNKTIAVQNPTAGPVDIEFTAVDYAQKPGTTGQVVATVYFTATPFSKGDTLKGGIPSYDQTYSFGGSDFSVADVKRDVGGPYDYKFKVDVTLDCNGYGGLGKSQGQQVGIVAAACKSTGGNCGANTIKNLIFTADSVQYCVFTSSFTPDMSVYVVPPATDDGKHTDSAGRSFFLLGEEVLVELFSKYYLTSTPYGFSVTSLSINQHAIDRSCVEWETDGEWKKHGVLGIKLHLNDATGNVGTPSAPKYTGCSNYKDLAFVDGANRTLYTIDIKFDVADGIPDFDEVDSTGLQVWYDGVGSRRRDLAAAKTVAASTQLDVRGLTGTSAAGKVSALVGFVAAVFTFML